MKQIAFKAGYKYQLAETYSDTIPIWPAQDIRTRWASLSTDGLLLIADGYAWDGPSGPAIDTKNFMRGSLVHDVLYQMIRLGLLPPECKDQADRLLQSMCIEDGMSKARAWWVYVSLSKFGTPATLTDAEPVIIRAP